MAATATHHKAQYKQTFHGRPDQVGAVRHAVAAYVAGCPRADDIVLVASEFAANAVLHSGSNGEFFSVACQLYPGYAWIEVEDLGGPWQRKPPDDRPHGLDIITALAGPDNWGTETTHDGNRVTWARLDLPAEGPPVPDPGRPRDVSGLTISELERTRRDLAISLALARPGSLAPVPIAAEMDAIDAELARRADRQA